MRNGDYAKAYCLWEPLAKLGHPDAQYNLAWLYANGHGLNVNIKTAVYWWQQAANNGSLDAQFSIGLAYLTGEGIKPDSIEAFRWFFSAARAGHADSRDLVKRLIAESGQKYYEQFPGLKNVDWLQQSVIILGDVVNLRAGPGTSYEVVYRAKKDALLTRVSQKGDWFEVKYPDSDGSTAWVYGKLVKSLN